MKKLILSVTATAGLAMAGSAQQVYFHDSNAANSQSNDVSITVAGVTTVDTTQDLNLELLVGSTAGNVTTDVVTLLLSQTTASATTGLGTVQPAKGDISFAGLIVDQTGNGYTVPAGTAFYQVLAWEGSSATFPGLGTATLAGESAVLGFNPLPAASAPAVEENLPVDINLTAVVPEPSTLAMAGVGLVSMLFMRRRTK